MEAELELDSAFATHAVEEMIDEDMVLANVEEMLEGFEWRGGGGGSSGWGGAVVKRGGKGDEIEKRLVGELKALEAVSSFFFAWFLKTDSVLVGIHSCYHRIR